MPTYDVRVAILYQDREQYLASRNTWREIVVPVESQISVAADGYGLTEIYEIAMAKADPPNQPMGVSGLTPIAGVVLGFGRRT